LPALVSVTEELMTVDRIMTRHPACCTPDTAVRDVARMMRDHDCGEIPLVQNPDEAVLLGVVTDRDIVCRLIAAGENPLELTAQACMSYPVITVRTGTTLDDCCRLMEAHQIRRIPVVDGDGVICGIVSQADIARQSSRSQTAEVVKEISERPHARAAGART
jgi:CBS domain-containing protein